MIDNSDLPTTRRSLLLGGAALAGLVALPLVPATLNGGLATLGSAFARHGADDGPNDDGHHTGDDDSGHHGGDDDDDHDLNDDNPGSHRGGHRHKNGGKDHHGPNHT